jgi:hypothetical protein
MVEGNSFAKRILFVFIEMGILGLDRGLFGIQRCATVNLSVVTVSDMWHSGLSWMLRARSETSVVEG